MTETQNLHLPQWEAEDRILRTDFNDAMASIDAAVAAETAARTATDAAVGRLGAKLLFDYTLTGSSSSIVIDVSEIDWSEWFCAIIQFMPVSGSTSSTTSAYANGTSSNDSIGSCRNNATAEGRYTSSIVMLPMFSNNTGVTSYNFSAEHMGACYTNKKFSAFTKLYINSASSTNMLTDGTWVKIWGIR